MLRKFLIPTVIVSILLLLTTLITIAKTEVASVVTSTTPTSITAATTKIAATTQIPKVAKATTKSAISRHRKITIIHAQTANPKGSRYIYHGRRKNIQGNNSNNNTANSRTYSSRIINTNRSYSNIRSNNNNYNYNNKQLSKNAEETTTSLLPLQPTLSVTSTTLASLIINLEQLGLQAEGSTNQKAKVKQQQQRQQSQAQPKPQKKQDQQQQKTQQQQQQQHRSRQLEQQKRQNRQPIQDVTNATTTAEPTTTPMLTTTTRTTTSTTTTTSATTTTTTAATTQQFEKHLINVAQSETDRQPKDSEKKELSQDFAKVEVVTAMPGVTNAYIPFELDYNDPTEEKARPPEAPKQSTLNEVLTNLFPKGFSDIFRFSYAADPEAAEPPAAPIQPKGRSKTRTSSHRTIAIDKIPNVPDATTALKPTRKSITIIKSTPMPFEPVSTEKPQENIKELLDISAAIPFKPMPTSKRNKKLRTGKNQTAITENSSNSDQIVVEKILADLGSSKSSEEFRDGSNSISKDELLRINRAAKQASVLPSMLLNPQEKNTSNKTELSRPQKAIVILNDNVTDDFVDAPEDDNQIAESQNIVQGVYHSVIPPQSVNYQQGQSHEINVHIVHDNTMKTAQDNEVQRRQQSGQQSGDKSRNFQSYQTFVEQAKNLQNSLQEAPSRKFLKNFNPSLSQRSNPSPIVKGNFHYEQTTGSHIQTVPSAAQMQYVLFQRPAPQHQVQEGEAQKVEGYNQQDKPQSNYHNTYEGYNGQYSENNPNKENDKPVHYIIQVPNYQHNDGVEGRYESPHRSSELHTHITDSNQLASEKDVYRIENEEYKEQPQSVTPVNLVFVTLNTPEEPREIHHSQQQHKHNPSKAPFLGLSQPYKLPSQYVHEAINAEPEQIPDHQPEETENNPKPNHSDDGHSDGGSEAGKGYTFVEIQKSINIHNKLITEKDGRLVEQHETIYPPAKYDERHQAPQSTRPEYQQRPYHSQQEPHNYVSLSKNPIHVESLEQHEPAESLHAEQHALNPSQSLHAEQHALDPSQSLIDIGAIQQSNLVQESHIIEQPLEESVHAKPLQHYPEQQQYDHSAHSHSQEEKHHEHQQPHHHHHQHHHEEHQIHHIEEYHPDYSHVEHHNVPEPSQNPHQPPVQVPYALPLHQEQAHHNSHHYQHYPQPLILQEIIEKHVHIPYAVPEPVAYPVPVQHFIDRPVPVETIVERPVAYPVEKVVEKVVEKHIPVEVEKIVEKPVEKIVEKYVDRPIAIPIKIPVALQITPQISPYSAYLPPSSYGGGSSPSNLGPWSQQPTLQRIPTKVLQTYYSKMLKKLVPQMTQAYKTSPLASKPKTVPKFTSPSFRIGDMRFDLKPPPPPALGSNWDVPARYQYEYNTLPLDLSASSSTAIGKQAERPGPPKVKTNFDEFQRWRNGHSLKRSPELGTHLHMEYGFKPPLVPSVEIDEKGIPLKAAADLTKGKDE